MIDSITLLLPKGSYKIVSPDDFKPSFEPINRLDQQEINEFLRVQKGSKRYILNPDPDLRKGGTVHPNLTIDEIYQKDMGMYLCNLKVSISCPKLLWGQSFDEVRHTDFTQVLNTLSIRLKNMGVLVASSILRDATVARVDFCRNMLFPSMSHARVFLDRLRKCSYPKLETDLTRFANDGKAVRFHSNLFEFVFYLKYYDLLEPLSRAMDRKRTKQEIAIAKELEKSKKIPPVVRMEVRFNGKRSVKAHLTSALGIEKEEWVFKDIFHEEVNSKVRDYYWNRLVSNTQNYTVITHPSDGDVCRDVLNELRDQRPRGVFEGLGLYYMLKTVGVPEMKSIFDQQWNEDTWYVKGKAVASFASSCMNPKTIFLNLIEKYNRYTF